MWWDDDGERETIGLIHSVSACIAAAPFVNFQKTSFFFLISTPKASVVWKKKAPANGRAGFHASLPAFGRKMSDDEVMRGKEGPDVLSQKKNQRKDVCILMKNVRA